VRAGEVDAELAPALRRAPAGLGGGLGGSLPDERHAERSLPDTGARVDRRDRRDLCTLGGAQVPTRVLIARAHQSGERSGPPAFGLLARAEGLLFVRRIGAVLPEMVPDGANALH